MEGRGRTRDGAPSANLKWVNERWNPVRRIAVEALIIGLATAALLAIDGFTGHHVHRFHVIGSAAIIGAMITGLVMVRMPGKKFPSDSREWGIVASITGPLALAAILIVGILHPALDDLDHARQTAFVDEVRDDWQLVIRDQGRQLQSLGAFFETTEVTNSSFTAFIERADWDFGPSGVTAIGYAPIIAHEDLDAFTASVRADEELPDIVRANFEVFPPSSASFHVPVRFVYPMDPAPGAIGFDLNTDPKQARTLADAAALEEVRASPPVTIVKPSGDSHGMTVALAVERDGAVVGYVTSVYVIDNPTLDNVGAQNGDYRIVDVTDGSNDVLYASATANWIPGETINAWGRTWRIDTTAASTLTFSEEILSSIGFAGAGITSLGLAIIANAYEGSRDRAVRLSERMLDQVRQEQKRRATIERLEELDAIRIEFVNNAAHELRTPLVPMQTHLYLLRNKLPEEYHNSLDIMERSVDRFGQTVDDMLLAAKAEAGSLHLDLKRVDLADIVEPIIETYRSSAEMQGMTIKADLHSVTAFVDAKRIEDVVSNFLTNALKYSKTLIHVKVGHVNGRPYISVEDDGLGIDREHLHALAKPFVQGKETKKGTGLGLYICKELAKLHGGRLEITSDGPGKGSCFTIRLPKPGT